MRVFPRPVPPCQSASVQGVYTILDGVSGRGRVCWDGDVLGVNNAGWWGEGEIKFYMDDDDEYPDLRHWHGGLLRFV